MEKEESESLVDWGRGGVPDPEPEGLASLFLRKSPNIVAAFCPGHGVKPPGRVILVTYPVRPRVQTAATGHVTKRVSDWLETRGRAGDRVRRTRH